MNRRTRVLHLVSLLVACANPPEGLSSNGLEATLDLTVDWSGGYCASVTVTNRHRAPSIRTWALGVDIRPSTLARISNARATPDGVFLSMTPATSEPLLVGASTSFEFCANKTGALYRPSLISLTADEPATADEGYAGADGGIEGGEGGGGSAAGGGRSVDEGGGYSAGGGGYAAGGGGYAAGGGSSSDAGADSADTSADSADDGGASADASVDSADDGGASADASVDSADDGGASADGGAADAGVACTPPTPGSIGTNPLFTDQFTAEPAVLVDNCTFYIQCSHDEAAAGQSSFVEREWLLLSSRDMVHWTKKVAMSHSAFAWARSEASSGQMVRARNGKYYWYVTVRKRSDQTFAIGVATATSPQGPWTDAIGGPLIDDRFERSRMGLALFAKTPFTIDPTVFVDDDGQAYLHYGGEGSMVVAKLKSDMTTIDGRMRLSTPANYLASPYLIKHDGTYFEIYASKLIPTTIDYATSSSPLGPWTRRGRILDAMPASSTDTGSPTNHVAVGQLANQWYIAYQVSNGPNGGSTYRRNVAVDTLKFGANGSIEKVVPSPGLRF